MTERYARDPDPGLVDRIAAWLFPSLYPDTPEGQVCIGPCLTRAEQAPKPELEAEL
jgi:hypothetical protein